MRSLYCASLLLWMNVVFAFPTPRNLDSCRRHCGNYRYRTYYGDHLCIYECEDIDLASLNRDVEGIKCTNCKIDYLTPFSLFRSLYTLEIVDSYLPNITIGLFNSVANLGEITLTSNNISYVQYQAFGGLRNLYSLNLSSNSITEIRLDDLSSYSEVEILDISRNFLRKALFPKSLKNLNLSRNEMTINNRTFSGLRSLISLDISHNKLASIPVHAFQDLIDLEILDLSHNDLVSFDYGSFSGLRKLVALNASFNSLSDVAEYIFHDVYNLEDLRLNNNNLSDIDIELVSDNLPHLNNISIHDNSWDCVELSHIIRTLTKDNVMVFSGNCKTWPSILNICCVKDDSLQDISSGFIETKTVLQTLNNFFNKDFVNSKFYSFFAKDYKEQNFWKYFDKDFQRTDMFRFFDEGFSQSQFYRYFNRDYFNRTFQTKIIDRIDSISPGENNVNVTELKETLKEMFGELFRTLNSSSSMLETLPENDRFVHNDSSYKDVLICVMATVIVLFVLYHSYKKCGSNTIRFDNLKLYSKVFKPKTTSAAESEVEIL